MKRKCPHTVQKSSVGCFRTDPVLGLMPKKKGSVLKPSCKPILLSTQFHKPI